MYYKVEVYIEADLADEVPDPTDTNDPNVRAAVFDNLRHWLRVVAEAHDELQAPIDMVAVPEMTS